MDQMRSDMKGNNKNSTVRTLTYTTDKGEITVHSVDKPDEGDIEAV